MDFMELRSSIEQFFRGGVGRYTRNTPRSFFPLRGIHAPEPLHTSRSIYPPINNNFVILYN